MTNKRQSMTARIRARLDQIEQPQFDRTDGLREYLPLLSAAGRRDIWSALLDDVAYREWLVLSDLHEQLLRGLGA